MRTNVMKQAIVVVLICLCCAHSFAQQRSIRDSLLQKSKNQKTGAWVLLGGGAALALGGAAVTANSATNALFDVIDNGSGKTSPAGGIMIAAGLASMAGSIPLFIAAGKNREKAFRISAGVQQVSMPVKSGWTWQQQPAITLAISINQ